LGIIKQTNTMKTFTNTHTTELISQNGDVLKHVRTQVYNDVSHKAKNEYFLNGKIVRNHDRYIVESAIDNTHPRDLTTTITETKK